MRRAPLADIRFNIIHPLSVVRVIGEDQLMANGQAQQGAGARLNSEYFPVSIDALRSSALEVDLHLVHSGGQVVLYRSIGSAYQVSDYDELAGAGVTHFYIPITQHRQFQRVMTERCVGAYEDPGVSRRERTRIVRDSCGRMIEDFMHNPGTPGLSETLGEMATRFSGWCNEDPSKFGYLMEMSEHDFYTTTHMVNVGVGCGLLGAELLGNDNPLVRDLMLGGLVHDVGKCGVAVEILNKEGKLTDEEWAIIRQHPQRGADILREREGQSRVTIDMTLNHHERLDGKGYPGGISGTELSLAARICGVVDIYDALTAARPYRGPIPPRKVLDMMREDVGVAIDAKVFGAWETVIERMLAEDPARATLRNPDTSVSSLRAVMPAAPGDGAATGEAAAPAADGGGGVATAEAHRTLRITRARGERVEATLIGSRGPEVIVRVSGRFRAGESVTLDGAGFGSMAAVYCSNRIQSDGTMAAVFKFARQVGQVA